MAGGGPDGLAAGRPGRRVHGEPARRRQERAPPAVRQRPVRHGFREADRPRLPRGSPVPPHTDRLHGRPGRRVPGGRARVLPYVLRAQQRGALGRRRHRHREDPRLGREVLRHHPRPRRQAAAARRLAAREHGRAAARGGRRGGSGPRADGRLPAPARRHPRVRRRRRGADRPGQWRVLPAAQPPGAPRPERRRGRVRHAAPRRRALAGLAGRQDLQRGRGARHRGGRRRGACAVRRRGPNGRGDGASPGPAGARVAGPAEHGRRPRGRTVPLRGAVR